MRIQMETGKNSKDTYCVGLVKKEELQTSYSLLIESEIDQLSFAILDNKDKECVGLCSIAIERIHRREALNEVLATNEILNFPFSKRSILMANRECVFIPEEIYVEEKNDFYIEASFGDNFKGKCFSKKLPELNNYIVFKVPEWLLKQFDEHLSGATISHSSAFLVESIYRISKQKEETIIHAHFKRSFFELVIFKNGKMLFYNSFLYQTSEDIAYFIMYALSQWEIDGRSISVSGVLDQDSDELYWLRKYLSEITIFPDEQLLPFPPAIEQPSTFINLLNPSLCEL